MSENRNMLTDSKYYTDAQGVETELATFMQDIIRIPSLSSEEGDVIERVRAEMLKVGFDEVSVDPMGNLIRMTDRIGISQFTYDALERLVQSIDPFGQTIGFEYDANGNRIGLIYPNGERVSYDYDLLGRMTSVTDWLSNTTIYEYDAAGQLINHLQPNGTVATYSYDASGRLTLLQHLIADS